jgi:SAM-dependent methyltransferase
VDTASISPDATLSVLEIGCGAGRNLVRLRELLPHAALYGFDGSSRALSMARSALPGVFLKRGDIHGLWPFHRQFDLVADITAGLPESVTARDLKLYVSNLWASLRNGGQSVVEGISSEDPSSKRFGSGAIVIWEHEGDTKTDRLMSMKEAVALYEGAGFDIVSTRIQHVVDAAFNDVPNIDHEVIQLIIQKPVA